MYHVLFLLLTLISTQLYSQEPIKLNQLGFYPDSEKIAILPGTVSGQFHLVDVTTEEIVYTNEVGTSHFWQYSGETVTIADFTEFMMPGHYRLVHAHVGNSYPFEIREYVYHGLARAALKAYYYNRASTELTQPYAGMWARPKGHPDESVRIHPSAATPERPANTLISSPKGWYDAGDFGKYSVNSGISTYTLLAAYEHFPEYFQNLYVNIPESGNGIPDILNEAKWNLDWLLTMQDPNDGGVYHKLTTANFPGVIMPHQDTAHRYVVMKSTAATLNFAAVMAVAARVYAEFDPDFASECLEAAEFAWEWATANPTVYYNQNEMNQQFNPNINTGEYGDTNVSDEFDWAAAELYITTGNDAYWYARNFSAITHFNVPSWQDVRALAFISLAHHRTSLTDAANVQHILTVLINRANILRDEYASSAYRISMGHVAWEFLWGSNGMALNHSVLLLQAYRLTNDPSYLRAAQSNLDYILGRNPTGYSFVTGYGSFTPNDPHHRQSKAGGTPEPVPGFVVGGPNPHNQYDCGSHRYPSNLPALSYLDEWCSYSTNEVAINWNAPLVYVAAALESIISGNNPPTAKRGTDTHPMEFSLDQNYPNPFNPGTTISFTLEVPGYVSLTLHDIIGRKIETIIENFYSAGRHTVFYDASHIPSGVYYYSPQSTSGPRQTRRMVVLR